METKELIKIVYTFSTVVAIVVFITSFVPIVFFITNFTTGREIFIEFIYGLIVDLILTIILFMALVKIAKIAFNIIQYSAHISEEKFELIFKNAIIKSVNIKSIYINCIKSSKIIKSILCISDQKENIFIKLDKSININLADLYFKGKYTDEKIIIKGKIYRINKLTNASS